MLLKPHAVSLKKHSQTVSPVCFKNNLDSGTCMCIEEYNLKVFVNNAKEIVEIINFLQECLTLNMSRFDQLSTAYTQQSIKQNYLVETLRCQKVKTFSY